MKTSNLLPAILALSLSVCTPMNHMANGGYGITGGVACHCCVRLENNCPYQCTGSFPNDISDDNAWSSEMIVNLFDPAFHKKTGPRDIKHIISPELIYKEDSLRSSQ